MLNIPAQVERSFRMDHCYKNIRIHFPKGEREDICNNLIVKDSVSFKESLCSQDSLKFGLCEASVFECETVGVGNIKDAEIEVYCEIECSPDVSGVVWRPDIQKYVYPLPYGTFIISESKRQADLNHRKIVAYSGITVQNTSFAPSCKYMGTYTPFEINDVYAFDTETAKNYVLTEAGGVFQYDTFKRMCARLNAPVVDDITLERDYGDISYRGLSYGTIWFSHQTYAYVVFGGDGFAQNNNNLYYAEFSDLDVTNDEIVDWLVDGFEEAYQAGYLTEDEYLSIRPKALAWLENYRSPDSLFPISLEPCVIWDGKSFTQEGVTLTTAYYTSMRNGFWIYPKNSCGNNTYDSNRYAKLLRPYRMQIVYGEVEDRTTLTLDLRNQNDYLIKKATSNYFGMLSLTQDRMAATNSDDRTGYALKPFEEDYYNEVLNGSFEFQGIFGKVGRNNKVEYINLKRQFGLNPDTDLYPSMDLHPQGVTGGILLPEGYQSCWYDDEFTKPYGAVKCDYKNSNNEDCSYTYYISGYDQGTPTDTYLTYDLSTNYLIRNGVWSQTAIRNICAKIAENISSVQYVPVEYVGQGLPYVEAGDTFEILTKSNDSITTIVLNRTITGEQTLTDSYKSV